MLGMAKFIRKQRLQCDSTFEIKDGYLRAIADLNRSAPFREKERRVFQQTFLNAIVLWYIQQDDEARTSIALDAMERLDTLMGWVEGETEPEPEPEPVKLSKGRAPKKAK